MVRQKDSLTRVSSKRLEMELYADNYKKQTGKKFVKGSFSCRALVLIAARKSNFLAFEF